MIANIEKKIMRKIIYRIVPYLFIIYFISFLDRSSITYAQIGGMDQTLGISATDYGFLAGIFFIGYFLFGVPGNIILEKIGAKKWISTILILWGIVTVTTGFVSSVYELSILRFLLGTFEASLFPGITLIVTYWFPNKYKASAISMFMIAPPLANALGAPVSMGIIVLVHQILGIEGWRWLFIIVGIPAIVLGIITIWFLSDDPSKAKWLKKEEKIWLVRKLDNEKLKYSKHGELKHPFIYSLKDRKILLMTLLNLFYVMGLYGITFWLPKIIMGISSSNSKVVIGWLTLIPYLLGVFALILNAKHSDVKSERIMHASLPIIIGGVSLFMSAYSNNVIISIIFISIATMGLYSWSGPYWAITTQLDPRLAAIGLGIVNAIGNLGGFLSPYIMGLLENITGKNILGTIFLSLTLILAGIIMITLKFVNTKNI